MAEKLMEPTDTTTPSDYIQEAKCAGVARRFRIKHCAPVYFGRLAEFSGQTWVAGTYATEHFINEDIDPYIRKSPPMQRRFTPGLDTEDTIDPEVLTHLKSLTVSVEDEFDDGLTDDDFDINARLTPPPISWRPVKVKLRYVGRELPRIHIDPDLEFDPELDE